MFHFIGIFILLASSLIDCKLVELTTGGPTSLKQQKPGDCNLDQYFDTSKRLCKNCTEIGHIFQGDEDWISREVGDAQRIPATLNKQNNNFASLQTTIPSRRVIKGSRQQDATSKDAILSRLISAEPPDQEYADSDLIDQDGAGSETDKSTDQMADTLTKMTRQTENFIYRFIRSRLIENELLDTMDQCKRVQNVTACQMWSNLCVLTMYSYSDIPQTASSSTQFDQTSSADLERLADERASKVKTWTQCRQFNINSICNALRDWFRLEKKNNLDIQSIFASDEPLTRFGSGIVLKFNQPIQLLAYKYALNGTLIGVGQFGLTELERFCVISRNHETENPDYVAQMFVGKNMWMNCRFDARSSLLNKNLDQTVFIDLYVGYTLNGATFVKPVPILNRNIMYNGFQINRKYAKDSNRWKLVHRFFFHTTLSYIDQRIASRNLDSAEGEGGDERPTTLNKEDLTIYAKSAFLEFKYRRQERGLLLNSLLLTINYGTLPRQSRLSLDSQVNNSSFQYRNQPVQQETGISVTHVLIDMQSNQKDLDLALTILGVVSSTWSLIKCYNMQKCYGIVKLDLRFLVRFIAIVCDTLGNLFGSIVFASAAYLFLTIKFQSTYVQVLNPSEELEAALILYLKLALAFKLVGLFHKVYQRLNVDIFFIDWEKPKMLTSDQILNYYHTQEQSKEQLQNKNSNQRLSHLEDSNVSLSQQASFWRPYTIINRWYQMQTSRRQHITLQLFLFVCVVDLSRLSNLATSDANLDLLSDLDSEKKLIPCRSVIYRIFLLSSTYLIFSLGQILFKKFIFERMICSEAREFVDLCSVANVSLFSMLYPRFGYYIHGRNANGAGDCGILEVNALLEREERDICSRRGLAPNSDHQTFVMILPRIINDHYKKLLFNNEQNLTNSSLFDLSDSKLGRTSNRLFRSAFNFAPTLSPSTSFSLNRTLIETLVSKNKAINWFLANFIDHTYKDIDYSIRERRKFESLLLDVDFEDEISNSQGGPLATNQSDTHTAATFCKDQDDSFTSLLCMGFELDLVVVELISLLILDLWLDQPLFITACLLWLLSQTFNKLYIACARLNLVVKSMLDEKFLIR